MYASKTEKTHAGVASEEDATPPTSAG